jgi:integrase
MARRANGEGTCYRLPNGRWRVIVTAKVAGKLKRRSGIRRKHADAVALLGELKAELCSGPVSSASTLTEYLARWLMTVKQEAKLHTYLSYEVSVRLHIGPRLGNAKLHRLSAMHIEEFKSAMIDDGVGSRAAQAAYQVLNRALSHAVYPLRIIKFNPCDGIKRPPHRQKRMQPFEAAEVREILASADGTRWHAFYAVAFGCGLRAGELFGLQWPDIDFIGSSLRVERQALDANGRVYIAKPKTANSVRTVSLPPFVVAALRQHQAVQMRDGLAGSQHVFPTSKGSLFSRANFYKDEWTPRLIRLGLTHRGVHNSRHTFATLALLDGVPVAVVSKALGHSSPAITMQTYAHCLPSMDSAAATAIGRLIG